MNVLKILCVSFKWRCWQKISMLLLGLDSKDRKSTGDKANICYPKVNRGCPPLTVNCASPDCVDILLGPSKQYIPWRVFHTGCFNAMETHQWHLLLVCVSLSNTVNKLVKLPLNSIFVFGDQFILSVMKINAFILEYPFQYKMPDSVMVIVTQLSCAWKLQPLVQ